MDPKAVHSKAADSNPPIIEPSDPPPTSTQPAPSNHSANITHLPNASIFAAPPHTLLLHACNARGSWGAGVAAAFKAVYPQAFKVYNKHCLTPMPHASSDPPSTSLKRGKEWQKSLVGTCLMIPPQGDREGEEEEGGKGHWVGCLFTSWGYGRQVDGAEEIVGNTRDAVADLRRQLEGLRKTKGGKEGGAAGGEGGIERVWSVKINSGMFGVEWERTEEVLKEGGVDMVIVTPKEGEGSGRKRKMRSGQGKGEKKVKKDDGGDEMDQANVDGLKAGLRKSGWERKQGGLDGWLK